VAEPLRLGRLQVVRTQDDPGDDLSTAPGAAAGGPAPEGGTASSASAKVPSGHLAAWTRLLGFHDDADLRDADPDTLRNRVWHLPARLARHARERVLKISPSWPWKDAFLTCWQRLCALPAPA
jgi:hypothetical protein